MSIYPDDYRTKGQQLPAVLRSIAPTVGSVWAWEPLKPEASETVRVTRVEWNGEECWVHSVDAASGQKCYPNSLDRWVETTVLVEPAPGDE